MKHMTLTTLSALALAGGIALTASTVQAGPAKYFEGVLGDIGAEQVTLMAYTGVITSMDPLQRRLTVGGTAYSVRTLSRLKDFQPGDVVVIGVTEDRNGKAEIVHIDWGNGFRPENQ